MIIKHVGYEVHAELPDGTRLVGTMEPAKAAALAGEYLQGAWQLLHKNPLAQTGDNRAHIHDLIALANDWSKAEPPVKMTAWLAIERVRDAIRAKIGKVMGEKETATAEGKPGAALSKSERASGLYDALTAIEGVTRALCLEAAELEDAARLDEQNDYRGQLADEVRQ